MGPVLFLKLILDLFHLAVFSHNLCVMVVYFIPLLTPEVCGNRRSLLVYACSLPPLPQPSLPKPSTRVCVVPEECGHHFGLFSDATGVSVAGISPFAIDVLCVILSSNPAVHHAVPHYLPYLYCIKHSEVATFFFFGPL